MNYKMTALSSLQNRHLNKKRDTILKRNSKLSRSNLIPVAMIKVVLT